MNIIQDSDDDSLEAVIKEAFEENPQALTDIKNGEMKAIGFIIGNVMKKSGGSANPQKVRELIIRLTKEG